MSGRVAKSQVPIKTHAALSPATKFALIHAKNLIKAGGRLKKFHNQYGLTKAEGPPLPENALGCSYYEFDVGQDRLGERGVKRLVIEIVDKDLQIREIYFTDEHYGKSAWHRIL